MTEEDELMTRWQRFHDHDEAELDSRIKASRQSFIAEHDKTFDFEAGWAEIVAQADAATGPTQRPELVAQQSNDQPADEIMPAVVKPQRRPGRRRVLAGVGSIAAAAAVVAAIVVSGGDGQDETDVAPKIVAATRSALADSIEHEVTDSTRTPQQVDDETWRDQTTAAVRLLHYASDGSGRSSDTGPATAPNPADGEPSPGPHPHLTVDYCFGEYAIEDVPIPEDATNISSSVAQGVAEQLNDGTMRTDGTETVDGRKLIRVIEVDGLESATWYVDPETYRPVRLVDTAEGYVTTIEYLPRTPERLEQFTPTIPQEFEQVDELSRTSEARPCS